MSLIALILRGLTALAGPLDSLIKAWQRWQDRQAGRAEQRAEDARHMVENAERITAARDAAPDTVGELRDRIERGKPL